MFHVFNLKRYVTKQLQQISYKYLELHPDLSYEEEVLRILVPYLKTPLSKGGALGQGFVVHQ